MLLGTVLGCLLVGGFTILGFRLARPLIQHAIIEHRIGGIDFSKCSASPETWGWSSGVSPSMPMTSLVVLKTQPHPLTIGS